MKVINTDSMNLKGLSKKEVVTSDGHIIGKVKGANVTSKGNVSSLSLKLDKDVVSGLRTTPNLRQDIEIRNIAGITDRVLLNQPLNGLGLYFKRHNENRDAERLIGMEVTDMKGTAIGTVDDLIIEHRTWKVPLIRVKVNSEEREALKMKSIRLAGKDIDISMGIVRDVGDMVVLNMTADHLNNILEAPPIRKN